MEETLNIDQFHLLAKNLKMKHLLQQGKYLEERDYLGNKVILYSCNNFFVEIWFNYSQKDVSSILAFSSSELLEPYFDEVDISDLWVI